MADSAITLEHIRSARARIAPLVVHTPLLPPRQLTERVGVSVSLKLESLQHTGSFKLRGAASYLLSLSEQERAHGVIAVSSGNHGRAVSYVCSQLGVRGVVVLSHAVPPEKVEGIRRYGAEVVVAGDGYDEAERHALAMQRDQALTFVSPFDDPAIIAGQGTIGLEISEDLPAIQTAIVPLSGGGLISGVALALKALKLSVRVIGVSMERGAAMAASLQAGRPVEVIEEPTLADALTGGIGAENHHTFRLCQALVDEVVLVSEEQIASAMRFMLEEHHLVVEGGGAVGVAALLYHPVQISGPAAVIISGGNISPQRLHAILRG